MRVVLVHGAYTSPWHWHRLVPHLEGAGCEVVVPNLPSEDPAAGIEQYVAAVEAEVPDWDDTVVVGSSLGALTATVLAVRHPVAGLVSSCGLVPRPGGTVSEDLRDWWAGGSEAAFTYNPDGTSEFIPHRAAECVFHDLEADLQREAVSRLRPQGALPFTQPCPTESRPSVPRAGVVCADDRLVRPDWQERAVRERLGVEPVVLEGDHVPMLSRPEQLAQVILSVAR